MTYLVANFGLHFIFILAFLISPAHYQASYIANEDKADANYHMVSSCFAVVLFLL